MRDAHAINLSWLLRLRWGAVVGQAALILMARLGLEMLLPLVPLFATVGIAAASNAALGLWARRRREIQEWMLWAVMALDVVLLTVLLDLSGGPFNPFSTLYLLHLALAAVVLRARWTWALVALALGCFGTLFVRHLWIPGRDASAAHHHIDDVPLHLEGMWVAFGLAAGFIVYFVQRVTRALAERDAELVAARAVTARNGVCEPFFTTKPPGEGMGLGLFLARAVLDQLGGRLELSSALGKGTRVEMTWPVERLRQFAPLSSEAGGASLQTPSA